MLSLFFLGTCLKSLLEVAKNDLKCGKCNRGICFQKEVFQTKMFKVIRTEFVSLVVGPRYVCVYSALHKSRNQQVLNIGFQKEVLMFRYVESMVTKNITNPGLYKSLRAL